MVSAISLLPIVALGARADEIFAGILTPELRGILTLLFMATTLTLMYYLLLKSAEQKRPKQTVTFTTIECTNCEFKDKRKFMKGDFIGKTVGSCPKCNSGTLYITLIYVEEVEHEKGPMVTRSLRKEKTSVNTNSPNIGF